jgi:hypothetical protein
MFPGTGSCRTYSDRAQRLRVLCQSLRRSHNAISDDVYSGIRGKSATLSILASWPRKGTSPEVCCKNRRHRLACFSSTPDGGRPFPVHLLTAIVPCRFETLRRPFPQCVRAGAGPWVVGENGCLAHYMESGALVECYSQSIPVFASGSTCGANVFERWIKKGPTHADCRTGHVS